MTAIQTAAPDLLLEADAITGLADGASVTTWSDGSGNGRHASGGVSPTYKTGAAPSGLPAVRFNGTSQYLTSSASTSASAQTVVAAVKHQGTGDRTIRGNSANGGLAFRYNSNGTLGVDKGGVVNIGNGVTVPPSGWHLVVLRFGGPGGAWDIRVDGTTVASGTTGTTPDAGRTSQIGRYGTDQWFNGDMGLVASWSRRLSDTELAGIEAEQATKWGTPLPKGEITASSSTSGWPAAALFDGAAGDNPYAWAAGGPPSQWVRAQFPEARTVSSYTLTARASDAAAAPKNWTFEGSADGSSWTALDTRTNQAFTNGQARTFSVTSPGSYAYYRLNISAITAPSPNVPSFAEWEFTYAAPNPFDGAAAAVSGVDGSVSAFLVVAGTVDGASAVDGTVTATMALSGQVDAASDVQGVVLSGVEYPFDGQADAASAVDGALSRSFPLDGQVDGVSGVEGDASATAGFTGQANAVSGVSGYFVGAAVGGASTAVGVTIEVGALTLLDLVMLPGTEVPVGVGLEVGDSQAVVPLPGVAIPVGASLHARPVELLTVDPRHKRSQWRYVITDLKNTPLGELTDLQHDPVEDAIGEPATMQFTMPASGDQFALVKPIVTQCQVWDGNVLRLRGPILPGQPSDDGSTITYKVHDPSWFWRDGRRVITRIPQKNLLKNGDFRQGLTYWSRGYDKDSLPKAAPKVQVVTDDFAMDTDGLDPIRAAEIEGVESFTQSELSSNAVFYPNLATFRPGGKAAVEAVANAMPTTPGLKVSVVGHTANDGTGNGLGLSLRRAEAAKAVILTKRPSAIVSTKGVGYYDPKPGFPIDSQEQRRVVIGYNQTITGKSLQWMKQTLEVTHPKSAKYGLELTAAWMLKVADAWSVEDANMMSGRLVARRKSTPKKIYDESNASISDTDPVDRWIPQTTSVTIPADGRTYTVDLYLYAPAAASRYAAVGLFPEEKLFFWGADQATIFRGVMEHIQKPEYGYADLGVGVRASSTGVLRDREFAFREPIPADTALDGLTAISRGIEWDTLTTATRTTAAAFYPRQGKTVGYVLALGGNVARATPANTRDVGSQVIAQAQDLGSYRAMAYASDKRAFGGTLIQRVVTAEQDTPLNELGAAAKAELFWSRSSTPAYWVDIDPDSIADVLANTAKGDTVRVILDGAFNVDAQARIVRRQIHPDSLRLMLAFEEA